MIDLHCHSTYSDGSLTPHELIQLAVSKRLTALALTDHDTIDGIEDFLAAAKDAPIEAVPGIELAACEADSPHQSYHILGLYIGGASQRLRALLADVVKWRQERNVAIIERLNSLGIQITLEEVQALSGSGVIGRPHIAQHLVQHGYVKDIPSAFDRYLATGKPGYVYRRLPTPAEAIAAIHDAGGCAVWAHPFTRGNYTVIQTQRFAIELKNCGLDGIEAYYSLHTPTQQRNALSIARAVGLVVSGGSDYHGSRFKHIDLATGYGTLAVPDELLEALRLAAAKAQH